MNKIALKWVICTTVALAITALAFMPFSHEHPITWIKISDHLYAMKTEVTVNNYESCVKANKCVFPKKEKFCSFFRPDAANMPMNCLSHKQAQQFCQFIGGSLPTVAEWEQIAQAGHSASVKYPWGNSPEPNCEHAVIDNDGRGCGRDYVWAVCSKPKGNSLKGICDLSGNAWEWTLDERQQQFQGKMQSCFVAKGGGIGSIQDYSIQAERCYKPNHRYSGLAFRCIKKTAS